MHTGEQDEEGSWNPVVIPSPAISQGELLGEDPGMEIEMPAADEEAEARLNKALDEIDDACSGEKNKIVKKTRMLLERRGILIKDPQDILRAVDTAMTEAEQVDIDERLSHFRGLRSFLGQKKCTLFPEILKELIKLIENDKGEEETEERLSFLLQKYEVD